MNILHILPSAFPGGSELCAFESIQVLQADGYKNFVIVPKKGVFIDKLSKQVTELFIVENNWWISNPAFSFLLKAKMLYGYLLSAFEIRKILKNNQIDLVITHTIGIPSGAIAARLAGISHIWYIHEYGDIDHNLKFNYGKKTTLFLIDFFSKKIIVNSKALLTHFSPYFSKGKIDKVDYVVNYPASNPALKKDRHALSICMVGRIANGKNQFIALKALAILKELNVLPQITFVGGVDSAYYKMLEAYIKAHELTEQVAFIGHTDTPWSYLQQADCVLVCSKNEAFGRVTVEAMKSGKIAVVSNTGAGKELIEHKKTGFLFNPNNAEELASILHDLWVMEDIGHITKAAQTFAEQYFNASVHGEALKKNIMQCI